MKKLSTKHPITLCYRVRAAKGMGIDEFAAFLGMSPQSVKYWERGGNMGVGTRRMFEGMAKRLKV